MKEVSKARLALMDLAREGMDSLPFNPSRKTLVEFAEKKLGIVPPKKGEPRGTVRCRMIDAARALQGKPPLKAPERKKIAPDRAKRFYRSVEWRRARVDALVKNDGRCELCGQGKKDGVTLNVDHIKPLRLHWTLRADVNNLQVLCNECNHGKGNRYEIDWR